MKALLSLILLALGGAAAAQERPADAAASAPSAIGDTTRQWLELQRGQTQAGKNHPMSGEVASLVHQRYLDSFRGPRQQGGSATRSREGGGAGSSGAEPRGGSSSKP